MDGDGFCHTLHDIIFLLISLCLKIVKQCQSEILKLFFLNYADDFHVIKIQPKILQERAYEINYGLWTEFLVNVF